MSRSAPHVGYRLEDLHQTAIDAAKEAVESYRRTLVQDQVRKARTAYREQSSKDGGSGSITLLPRHVGTVRFHTLLVVCGTGTTVTIQLGDDVLVFPIQTSGYIFLNELDIVLGRGDIRKVTLGTPGNPLFFGLYGEEVGDALVVG